MNEEKQLRPSDIPHFPVLAESIVCTAAWGSHFGLTGFVGWLGTFASFYLIIVTAILIIECRTADKEQRL